MKIPSNTLWTQTNQGDVLGSLSNSQNVSLDTPGKVIGTKKPVALVTSGQDADFGYPLAIVYFGGEYVVVTDDEIFEGGLSGSSFTQTATFSPASNLGSDAVIYEDTAAVQLIVSTDSNFARWNGGGSVSYALGALTSGVPHPMCVMADELAIGNGNELKLFNTSYVNTKTLTIPADFEITTVRARNTYYYIGTRNVNGGEASVFTWNGDGTAADYNAPVGASWVFSLTEYESSVAAITSQGQLGLVNGNTFTELATLPIFHEPHARWQGAGGLQLNGKVFNRGMVTVGKSIYINLEGDTDTGFIPSMKSGLWVYDPEVGLYHRATASTDALVRDNALGLASNTLALSVVHSLKTGDGVVFTGISGLSGVSAGTTYYVTVISPTTIKLSHTRKAVDEARYISITGTPGASDVLLYAPNADYGSQEATSGAITTTVYNETPQDNLSSEVIFGCRTYEPDGSSTYVLNAFSDQYNISRFETQRIYSDNVEQSWKDVIAFVDGIKNSSEQLVFKVQSKSDRPFIELAGAWLDSNTINNVDSRTFNAWGDLEIGDEVIFTDGQGQGRTAHIIAIDSSAATYSITLDESFGTAGLQGTFYSTAFQRISTLSADNNQKDYLKDLIQSTQSSWVKLAVEMRGFTPAVNRFELSNAISKGTK